MNIQTRGQFEQALVELGSATIVVADTETNGLHPYRGDQLISISVFLPEYNTSYNFPFRYGEGRVEVKYSETNHEGLDFSEMNWQGKTKKSLYLAYWFEHFRDCKPESYFGNLPIEWLDEIKEVWGLPNVTYIFHNARFDLHVLHCEGFPDPYAVEDTMEALHIVHEDWRGIRVVAPFTWTEAMKRKGECRKEDIGKWARNEDGTLRKREMNGNRRLKWQSALHGFENATVGEEELFAAKVEFENELAEHIYEFLTDPMNDGLVYKSNQSKEKQLTRLRSKLDIDSKSEMWMLPSDRVSYYAELDCILTWDLYSWCMKFIEKWDNMDLYYMHSLVHYRVAYRMERNGLQLDAERATTEIELLRPYIEDMRGIFNDLATEWLDRDELNPASPVQLIEFFNTGVLGQKLDVSWYPEWWEDRGLPRKSEAYPDHERLNSSAKEALEPYEDHVTVALLKEFRRLNKSANTYLANWVAAMDGNQVVHGSMNVSGTVSGRFSSSGDAGNLQNIPDRNGYTIKSAFVPYNDDWMFAAIDYGQLEARVAAWIAEGLLELDPNKSMTTLFNQGADMHAYTRDMVDVRGVVYPGMSDEEICVKLGYSLDKLKETPADTVSAHCRQMGKTMNFGLLYGGTEYMLSTLLKIGRDEAAVLVAKWRNLFPAFLKAQGHFMEEALTRRRVPTGKGWGMYVTQPISGRHRKIHKYPDWIRFYDTKYGQWKSFNAKEAEAKKVWNNIVQGLAGYFCTVAALYINDKYNNSVLRMFANIHDALDFYVHRDHLYIVQDMMDIMVDWPTDPFLTVDLEGSITTWQDMREVDNFDEWCNTRGTGGYKVRKQG